MAATTPTDDKRFDGYLRGHLLGGPSCISGLQGIALRRGDHADRRHTAPSVGRGWFFPSYRKRPLRITVHSEWRCTSLSMLFPPQPRPALVGLVQPISPSHGAAALANDG